MNILYFLIIAIACAATPAGAQATQKQLKNATPEERAQKITDWMKSTLQLSDDQATSVHAINLKYAVENESLKDEGTSRRNKARKLRETQEAKEEELRRAMTADQFKTYLERKKELQRKMREEVREQRN